MKTITLTARYNYDELCQMLPLGESFCVNLLTANYLENDQYELVDNDYDMTVTVPVRKACKYIYAYILLSDIKLENQNILERNPELDDAIRLLNAQFEDDIITTYADLLRKIIASAEKYDEI